jgi:peptide/nickel transport system permease protein
MPGSTQRSATADEVSPTPGPSPLRGRGEQDSRRPLSSQERGLGGEVRSRQPALLPAVAVPSTTLQARPRPRRRPFTRVTGVARAAGLLLLLIILAAIMAPLLAPHSPYSQELLVRLSPPGWLPGGSWERPLGADDLGRDVLSRLLYGSRVSLVVGLSAALIGSLVGTALGLVAGYAGGVIGDLTMLLADAQLALPFLVLAIGLIAVVGPSLGVLIVLAGVSGWTAYARVTRGLVLGLLEQEFVLAARALGASTPRLLFCHIGPNLISTVAVLATLQLASVILLESTLSFLGLGVQPPEPSWGSMLGAGREYLNTAWWISVFPGLALMATILAVSLGGDWLRDVLDPNLRHEQS